jgi:transposase
MGDGSPSTKTLYARILGLTAPWEVVDVDLRVEAKEVHITVAVPEGFDWFCPECQDRVPIHDHRERTWRHLDTCQLQTFIHARVPRLGCKEHGVRQVRVPWAEDGSRFTALFEALVIDWLQEASVRAVAFRLGISWDQAMGIMKRAVVRGEARETRTVSRYIGVDETSERKGHRYLTIVSNLEESKVLFVSS